MCPNCGAALYWLEERPKGASAPVRSDPEERSREAASTGIVAPSGAPRPTPSSPASDQPDTWEPTRRSRAPLAFIVVALVLLLIVGSWLNAHTPSSEPRAAHPRVGLTGTIVYAVPDGKGWSRLWRWDLATGATHRGPRVPRAIELVNAQGAAPGWVGVTSELVDGRLQASVLRSLGPQDRPSPILRGDIVSWGPAGATVTTVRHGRLRRGCRRRVSISWAKLVPALRERKFAAPGLCGDVPSVGTDGVATFFTLVRGDRVGIFLASVGRIRSVLPGHALVAISGQSDMIVAPTLGSSSIVPVTFRPGQEHGGIRNPALFFRGVGATGPVPFVVEPPALELDRVLAWSPDGLQALVEGTVGDIRGLYLLDTGLSDGIDAPRFVEPVEGVPYATFTQDGIAIVETRSGMSVVSRDGEASLDPPGDAVAPMGPIVWLR